MNRGEPSGSPRRRPKVRAGRSRRGGDRDAEREDLSLVDLRHFVFADIRVTARSRLTVTQLRGWVDEVEAELAAPVHRIATGTERDASLAPAPRRVRMEAGRHRQSQAGMTTGWRCSRKRLVRQKEEFGTDME
jgi:hypothetical protein